jgi:hypothetical protein
VTGSYNETRGPTDGPEADKILYSRVLMARSSNDIFSGVDIPGLVGLATW